MSKRLQDKICLFPPGVGRAIVDKFLAEGATVIAADIAPSAESEGALSVQLDQASEESVASLEQWLSQRFGRLDCLVNNAALGGHQHPLHLKPLSEFDSIMAVNVRGPWLLSQMAIRLMLPAKKGIVINISSIVGQRGAPNSSAYAISKSALNGLTRCLATEYAGHGIRCVSISPGYLDVPNVQGVTSEARKALVDAIPQKRTCAPAEIANCVCFVASDECSYMNGTDILVDGGVAVV